MKKQFVYIGSIIILVISVVTFVFMGAGVSESLLNNKNSIPTFGKYDGKKIQYTAGSDFAAIASNFAENYKSMGYELNSQIEYYIFSQAFNQTIMNMAFTKAVAASGYKVPEDSINRQMLPYFYDETGKYSPRLYNQTDDAKKMQLRDQIQNSLTYSRYTDDILGSNTKFNGTKLFGIKASSAEDAFLAEAGSNKRSFSMAAFTTTDLPKEEAVKFGKANPDLFKKYDISAITVDEEAAAKKLLKQIKANEVTFADALAANSKNYYTDAEGKLASPYQYQLTNMLSKEDDLPSVMNLAKDEVTDVIETKRGFTIFQGNGPAADADFSSDDMAEVALKYVNIFEGGYIENYFSDVARDFTADAKLNGFEAACEKYNVKMQEVPAFPVNYGDSSLFEKIPSSSVSEIANGSADINFLKKAFSLKLDEISEPIVLGNNVIVLKLTGIQKDEPEADTYSEKFVELDQSSALSTLMASDKLENHFTEVFFANFMN